MGSRVEEDRLNYLKRDRYNQWVYQRLHIRRDDQSSRFINDNACDFEDPAFEAAQQEDDFIVNLIQRLF